MAKNGEVFFGGWLKMVESLPFFAIFCQNLMNFASVYIYASILFARNNSYNTLLWINVSQLHVDIDHLRDDLWYLP